MTIEPARPMVFAGVYPFNQGEIRELKAAIEKLALNDRSVSVNMETSLALGSEVVIVVSLLVKYC